MICFGELLTRHAGAPGMPVEIHIPDHEELHVTGDGAHGAPAVHVRFVLGVQSRLQFTSRVVAASGDSTLHLEVVLAGAGATANIRCIVLGRNEQQFTVKTLQHHRAPHTKSMLAMKGVLFDSAKLVANNLIRIEKEAQHTQAREENKNLLLGRGARVVTIPKLEVEANEVSCEHGAAISRLSEEQLFYLESRGFARSEAEQLLIDAFLQ